MDQNRTGAFISQMRKEKKMTQKDLADCLGITDRAISKWENGRGMPDVSLMKPLCDALGITVGELLSGERIEQMDYREKSESGFLDTMEFTDKKLKQKKILLRVIAIAAVLLLAAAIVLLYWIPVTRGYFREDEELSIYWVKKTLPVTAYGEPLERFSLTDFVDQDITEKVNLERLEALLPLMQVTVYKEDYNASGFWKGDYIYEIFGCFTSGPRQGETFLLMIGDNNRNYLMPYQSGTRIHTIAKNDTWLNIMEELESWEGAFRETFLQEEPRVFSLYYQGCLYAGDGQLLHLPDNAERVGTVQQISAEPDEELECSIGTAGDGIYLWAIDGQTYLAVQISYDQAYGIAVEIP